MKHTNLVEPIANRGWDERILVLHNPPLVNAFLIITTRFVILVDTLIDPTTAGAMLDAARPHLYGERSLLVVNTHADYDHIFGNQLFAGPEAVHPAPIIGRRATAGRFKPFDDPYLHKLQAEEPEIFGPVRPTSPNLLFEETLILDGEDLKLELFAAPGHTGDHTAIYIPEIKTLLAGDAAELPFPYAESPAALPVLRATLQALAGRRPAAALYCHAPVDSGPQLLHDNIAYFDALEERCRAALARGVPADPPAGMDVIRAVGCPFEEITPAGPPWEAVSKNLRTAGHAQQIRTMLAWLASAAR